MLATQRSHSHLSPRDDNAYQKPKYLTDFIRYVDGYVMISISAGMLIDNNLYPLGRRVRVSTTHTHILMVKIYMYHIAVIIK
jgi:hypothetical protein